MAEALRIDSSGRLLLGVNTARSDFYNGSTIAPALQIQGTGNGRIASITAVDTSSSSGPVLVLAKSRSTGNTVVQSGDYIGEVSFQGSDGSEIVEGASIAGVVDATPGSNDMPTRLMFNTTADGASSPTERMRITSDGVITAKNGAVAEIATLTSGSTVTPNFNSSCNFTLTLGTNVTLANPSSMTPGQSGSIFLVQDLSLIHI